MSTGGVRCWGVAAVAAAVVAGCSSAREARRLPSPPPHEYVALGDSFTSGPLIPNAVGIPGCLRSDRNYPSIVAAAIGAGVFRDASCSGATTEHMAAPQVTSNGTNPPQLDALTRTTTIVTIGIGGNDIGFGELAALCSSPLPVGSPCRTRFVVAGRDTLLDRLSAMRDKVAAVLARIRERSPLARILVVGYPAVVPTSGAACWPQLPFTAADGPYLRDVQQGLVTNLGFSVVAANLDLSLPQARLVDVYLPSAGHDACQPPATRWVEPLVPAAPAAALHPNATGMAAIAALVGDAV